MIVNVFNDLINEIQNEINPVPITIPFTGMSPEFPIVTMDEISNETNVDTVDSSGEYHNIQSFELNIYTVGISSRTKSHELRDKIDNIMTPHNMNRTFSQSVPNYLDDSIYRYVLRYECIIGKDKKFYRR